MSEREDDLDLGMVEELLGKANRKGGGAAAAPSIPVLGEDDDEVLPVPVIEEAPPDDEPLEEPPPEEEEDGSDRGGGPAAAPLAGAPASAAGAKPWEAAPKKREVAMPPGVRPPGSGAPTADLVPPVWVESRGPELVADPGRVAVVPGNSYPRVIPSEEFSQAAMRQQLEKRLGFLAGVIAPKQAIQEKGQGMLEALAGGKPQIKPIPRGSAKHTPPTATRDRLPAIDNQAPTRVGREPSLVKTGLDVDSLLAGAVPIPVGGPGVVSGRGAGTGSWLDDVPSQAPSRGRVTLPGLEDAGHGHGSDLGGVGHPEAEDFSDFEVPAAADEEGVQVVEPGLPHHRFQGAAIPTRRPKVKEAPPAPPKVAAPEPAKAPVVEKGGGSPGGGLFRDFMMAGAACLVGGAMVLVWGRVSAARNRDAAVALVVERKELVTAYLDSEIAGLEREAGEDDQKLAAATKGLSPEPTADELRRIEVLAREKAQVELLLEVMRARKRSFLEGVGNGGQ